MITDNLVRYYKLDGNSTDSTGTLNGVDTAMSYGAGQVSQAGVFNGTSSHIAIGAPQLAGVGSFSLWINQDAPIVAEKRILSDAGGYVYLSFLQTGVIQFATYDTIGRYATFTTQVYNVWYHVVCTWNGTNIKLYVNGILRATSAAGSLGNVNGMTIGSNGDGYGFFNGKVDEVGIWQREITQAEVTFLYNNGYGISYPFIPNTGNFFNLF